MPGSGTAIDIIGSKLGDLVELMKEEHAAIKDATTDLLKLIFNLCVHYPKVCNSLIAYVGTDSFRSSSTVKSRVPRLQVQMPTTK